MGRLGTLSAANAWRLWWLLATVQLGMGTWLASIPRAESTRLLVAFAAAVAVWWGLYRLSAQAGISRRTWLAVGLLSRLPFLFLETPPLLSEDWMRYAWDGWLVSQGQTPFAHPPATHPISGITETARALLAGMNSRDYRAIYPPVAQYLFAVLHIGAPSPEGWLLRWRLLIFGAEAVTLAQLARARVPLVLLATWALHPFVIQEGMVSGHADILAVAALALVLSTVPRRIPSAAVAFALAIATKVFPIFALPAWLRSLQPLDRRRALLIGATSLLTLGAPFLMTGVGGAFESAGLFAHTFEFNASLYFVARAIGTAVTGYNPIATVGPVLLATGLTAAFIIGLRAQPVDWRARGALAIGALLVCATTIHPWYLLYPLLLGLAAGHRWPWVWATLSWLSYLHYGPQVIPATLWLMIEYGVTAAVLALDLRTQPSKPQPSKPRS
jgi:hypothetical protein